MLPASSRYLGLPQVSAVLRRGPACPRILAQRWLYLLGLWMEGGKCFGLEFVSVQYSLLSKLSGKSRLAR